MANRFKSKPTDKVQLQWNIVIPADSLQNEGLMLQRKILIHLLDEFSEKKATKDLDHYIAVTTVDKKGEGKVRRQIGDVLFPVTFSASPSRL